MDIQLTQEQGAYQEDHCAELLHCLMCKPYNTFFSQESTDVALKKTQPHIGDK